MMQDQGSLLDDEPKENGTYNPDDYRASASQRFINYFIDTVVIIMLYIFLTVVVGFMDAATDGSLSDPFVLFAFMSLFYVYYAGMEATFGKTIGKMVTGTSVVDLNGNRPTAVHVLGRTLCRAIPFDNFSFLFSDGLGWHDKVSGTRVVTQVPFVDQREQF